MHRCNCGAFCDEDTEDGLCDKCSAEHWVDPDEAEKKPFFLYSIKDGELVPRGQFRDWPEGPHQVRETARYDSQEHGLVIVLDIAGKEVYAAKSGKTFCSPLMCFDTDHHLGARPKYLPDDNCKAVCDPMFQGTPAEVKFRIYKEKRLLNVRSARLAEAGSAFHQQTWDRSLERQ